ncbi:MAG: hypothetical protein GW876_08650 [Bacteroidetes bacterium]|nr:hypothetical protein [Bacteroidota bacterium]PIX33979.1 MAG: hypothetical protein COZ59_08725 [Bacteroidetes bacterium CG_4_8_14_3_um_filter_31_14]
MLIENLFNIINKQKIAEGEFLINFNCNSKHIIFEGHFPTEPILPGVCMVQFVRESIEMLYNKKIKLISSKTVKFIHIIDPRIEQNLVLELKINYTDNNVYETRAIIKNDTTTFFQMRGNYAEF